MSVSRKTCLRAVLVLAMSSSALGSAWAQTALGYSAVVDVNGDGYADIAEHHTASGNFYVRLNNGNGTFQAPGFNWTSGTTSSPYPTWQVLLRQRTGSGFTDYIEIHRPSGQVWQHAGTGSGFSTTGTLLGTLTTNPDYEFLVAQQRYPWSGFPSLIFSHNRYTGALYAHSASMTINWGLSSSTTQTGTDWRIAFCDMNADGRSDLIEYHLPSAQFSVRLANDSVGMQFNAVASIFGVAFNHFLFTAVFGDYNADGRCDYADVNKSTGEFWVHLNNGNGTFNPANYAYGTYTPNAGFSIMGLPVTFP